jgi:hypothetical protein
MRLRELFETASGGATSAGNVVTVVNPHITNSKNKKARLTKVETLKNANGTAQNALDSDISLFGGTVLKR